MMWLIHLLLLIAKWLGILVLAILLLIILSIILVLLVPIRYRLQGSYYDRIHLDGKITWFWSAVTILIGLNNKNTDLKIKVFGISVIGGKKKKTKTTTKITPSQTETPTNTGNVTETDNPGNAEENVAIDNSMHDQSKSKEVSKKQKKQGKTKAKNTPKAAKKPKQEKKAKIEALKEKVIFLKEQWSDEGNQALLRDILFRVKKILLHLLPTKLSLKVHFGLDNPATMGQVLSILALLYPIYGDSVQILPEMEEKIIEGEGFIKGRIRLIVFVYAAIRILLNPQVRILIRRFKRQNGVRS